MNGRWYRYNCTLTGGVEGVAVVTDLTQFTFIARRIRTALEAAASQSIAPSRCAHVVILIAIARTTAGAGHHWVAVKTLGAPVPCQRGKRENKETK